MGCSGSVGSGAVLDCHVLSRDISIHFCDVLFGWRSEAEVKGVSAACEIADLVYREINGGNLTKNIRKENNNASTYIIEKNRSLT